MKSIVMFASLSFAVCCISTVFADTFGSGTNTFSIDFVTIGNPGNAADTTGNPNPAGKVDFTYRVGKYEIPENLIDKVNALSNLSISHDNLGPNKPAFSISWFDAAKFVNWLNADSGNTPAYKFDANGDFLLWTPGDVGYSSNNLYRNSQAKYFLPSIDEWYKAAYFDPAASIYYDYPTGSDIVPDGIGFEGDSVFEAVFFDGSDVTDFNPEPNDVTDVGLASPYGTFGQGGNVWEWEETSAGLVNDDTSAQRVLRGGSWVTAAGNFEASFRRSDLPIPVSGRNIGFRVASTLNTVINIPQDQSSIFFGVGSDTQLNLSDGGEIGSGILLPFQAGAVDGSSTHVEVNISGGTVGDEFNANSGSTINIFGGTIGEEFTANAGSTVNISGGEVGGLFKARNGSVVNISGGNVGDSFDFITGDKSIDAESGSTLTVSGGIIDGEITMFDGTIADISGGSIGGLSAITGSTVNFSGGVVGRLFAAASSFLEFSGGEYALNGDTYAESTISVESILDEPAVFTGTFADGSVFIFSGYASDFIDLANLNHVTLPPADTTPIFVNNTSSPAPPGLRPGQTLTLQDGGTLPRNFAVVNATLNVEDGSIGNRLEVAFSEVNISGGFMGDGYHVYDGSTVTISGGDIGEDFHAHPGSTIDITGGTFGRYFNTDTGSIVNVTGGEFTKDGMPYTDPTVSVGFLFNESVFTGTLADGSVFIFARVSLFEGDTISLANLNHVTLPPADTTPIFVNNTSSPAPPGLRPGQTLTLQDGGTLPRNFAVVDATLNIEGGTVGDGLEVAYTEVNISGGELGDFFTAYEGSTINISGGIVSAFGSQFFADEGSTTNIVGSQFTLDGEPITGLLPNEPFEIATRDGVELAGVLQDGTPFDFVLNDPPLLFTFSDFFSSDAVLTISLAFSADFNGNGIVDAADYTVWRDNFGSTSATNALGDADGDSDVDGADFLAWQRQFGTTAMAPTAAVPEPSSWLLILMGSLSLVDCCSRRSSR